MSIQVFSNTEFLNNQITKILDTRHMSKVNSVIDR